MAENRSGGKQTGDIPKETLSERRNQTENWRNRRFVALRINSFSHFDLTGSKRRFYMRSHHKTDTPDVTNLIHIILYTQLDNS